MQIYANQVAEIAKIENFRSGSYLTCNIFLFEENRCKNYFWVKNQKNLDPQGLGTQGVNVT